METRGEEKASATDKKGPRQTSSQARPRRGQDSDLQPFGNPDTRPTRLLERRGATESSGAKVQGSGERGPRPGIRLGRNHGRIPCADPRAKSGRQEKGCEEQGPPGSRASKSLQQQGPPRARERETKAAGVEIFRELTAPGAPRRKEERSKGLQERESE